MAIEDVGLPQRIFVDLSENPILANCVTSVKYLYRWGLLRGNKKELLRGIVVQDKAGDIYLIFAGDNNSERTISLGIDRIEKTMIEMIEKIPSSSPEGNALHGFIVRLTNGDRLYLTFSIKSTNPTRGGKHISMI